MTTFHKRVLISVVLIVITVILFYYLGLSHYFSLESVKTNAVFFKAKVAENYLTAVLMFIGISTALIIFTLPISAPMGVVGGFLFGIWPGVFYCMIAALVGTAISFLVVRYALSHIMQHRYGRQLAAFNERMKAYGYTYLITLQLLTVVPYFVINTLAALAGVSFWTFMFTTAVGSFPVIAIYAFAGRQLYRIRSWGDLISTEMLLLLLLLGALALVPMMLQKWRKPPTEDSDETTL